MSSSVATWGPSGRLVPGGLSKPIARHVQDTIEALATGDVTVGFVARWGDVDIGTRTTTAKLKESHVSLLDWTSVDPTGGNACTNELQAAAAQALAAKLPVFVPPGTYSVEDETDLRNVATADARCGIFGLGRGKSIIQRVNANGPILRTGGRYTDTRGLTLKFNPYATEAQTLATCISAEDLAYFSIYDDLLLMGGWRGMWGHSIIGATPSFFSNIVSNIRSIDHCYYAMDLAPSTGNVFNNWHCSANGRNRVFGIVRINGAFQGVIQQLNCEHAVCIDRPLFIDNCLELDVSVHFEGIVLLGNGAAFDTAGVNKTSRSGFIGITGRGINRIRNWQVDSCYIGGNKNSSISQTAGVATAQTAIFDSFELNNNGHGFVVGDVVTIAGFAEAAYNGTHTITAIGVSADAVTAGKASRYDTFSFAVDAGTSSPGTLPSGTDYSEVCLGTSSAAVLVDIPTACETFIAEVLHVRDTTVVGSTSAARASAFRAVRDSDASSGRVIFERINTQGEPVAAWASATLNIAAMSRDASKATIYTRERHFFRVGHALAIPSATLSGYASSTPYTVTDIVNGHAFKLANTSGVSALAKETTGTVLPGTYTITSRAKAGGLITLTIGAHALKEGNRISVRCNGTGYTDSETAVHSVTSTTISYRSTDTDTEATTAALGVVLFLSFGLSASTLHDPSTGVALKEWGHFFEACACLSFGAINANATASDTATITGAAVGDGVEMRMLSDSDDGLIVHRPRVTSANTITVKATNASGSNIAAATPIMALLRLVRA